eukprot:4348062-Prymnesium_polylepis.1
MAAELLDDSAPAESQQIMPKHVSEADSSEALVWPWRRSQGADAQEVPMTVRAAQGFTFPAGR